ncbi:hypothetical protein HK105_207947 [Polyrhizophydium stewartii]|uniref:Ankyrin repeat protein n=1 Tax=Polyrhizophydium stewartii TaxID=2732419 RepID=A0ABR4MZ74_9FUNG
MLQLLTPDRRRRMWPPLPPGASLWDRLPFEIRHMVLAAATTLTLLTMGRVSLADIRCLSADDKARLWAEVFDTDWDGDLTLLAAATASPGALLPLPPWVFWLVRSRRMVVRIKQASRAEWATGLLHAAARNDCLDAVGPVHRRWPPRVVAHIAASSGALNMLRAVAPTITPWDLIDAVPDAAAGGHMRVVEWIHSATRGDLWPPTVALAAVEGNDDDLLDWLLSNRRRCINHEVALCAVRLNRIRMLDKLLDAGFGSLLLCGRAADLAAGSSIEMLDWFVARMGCTPSHKAMQLAVTNRQADCILRLADLFPDRRWTINCCDCNHRSVRALLRQLHLRHRVGLWRSLCEPCKLYNDDFDFDCMCDSCFWNRLFGWNVVDRFYDFEIIAVEVELNGTWRWRFDARSGFCCI